jgi:hypothetical protein
LDFSWFLIFVLLTWSLAVSYFPHKFREWPPMLNWVMGAFAASVLLHELGHSVVTSGGGDEEPIAEYINHFLTITGIRPVGSVWGSMGRLTGPNFLTEITEKAVVLEEKLVESWQKKTPFRKLLNRNHSDFDFIDAKQ